MLTPANCCCRSAGTGSYPEVHCGGWGFPQPRPHAHAEKEPEIVVQTSSVASSDGGGHLRGESNMQGAPTLVEVATD